MRRSSELLQLERARGLGNFFWFSKYVFGNKDMEYGTHGELCETLQYAESIKETGTTEILILMPRGTFKSSIASQAYPVWRYLHNPNIRILITNEARERAAAFLGAIKSTVQNNEYFASLYGDQVNDPKTGKPRLWNLDSVTLSGRNDWTKRESTLSIGSQSSTKTGMHYDLIIADDLISEKTVTTPQQIRKTLIYYRQLQSLLDPGGVLVIIGTRYNHDDLYGTLIKRAENGEAGAPDKIIIEKAEREDGSLFFPEKRVYNSASKKFELKGLGRETLNELKSKLGSYMFSCQYMNEPTSTEDATFSEDDFRYFGFGEELVSVPSNVARFLLVDPARSTSGTADYSALVSVAVDEEYNIYVEDAVQIRCVPSALIDHIYGLHEQYNYLKIGIEQFGAQTFVDWILDRVRLGGKFLPVTPVKVSNTASKDLRIRAIEPYYKQHRVFHRRGLSDLEDQLLRFPNLNHDDLIDALSMFPHVAYRPDPIEVKKQKEPDRVYHPTMEEIKAEGKKTHYMFWGDDPLLLK